MPLADRPQVVTQAVFDRLREPSSIIRHGATEESIYWPDQVRLPQTPAICVDTGPFVRDLAGIGGKGQTENRFTVYIMCYLCRIADIQQTQQSVEDMASAVMDCVHEDVTLNGVIIHGFVTGIEPGYSPRSGILYRTARVTWEGLSKTLIA